MFQSLTRIILLLFAFSVFSYQLEEGSGDEDPCLCFKYSLKFTKLSDEYTFKIPDGQCDLHCQMIVKNALKEEENKTIGYQISFKLEGAKRAILPCTQLNIRPVGGQRIKIVVVDPRTPLDVQFKEFTLVHKWMNQGYQWEKHEYDEDDYDMWITIKPKYFEKQ